MKTFQLKCALAAAAALLAGAAEAQQPEAATLNPFQPIYVRTDGLPQALARRVEEEAQKGLQPLRRYVQRTKFIHQLDLISLLMTRDELRAALLQDEKVHVVRLAQD